MDNNLKSIERQTQSALAAYLTFLEGSAKGDAGSPLITDDATAIATEYGSFSCSTAAKLTDTCICQKDFWKTDQSAGKAAFCSATTAYTACLKGKTVKACDTTTTVAALTTGINKRNLGSCVTCDTCKSKYTTDKGAATDNPEKCIALAAYLTCLEGSEKNDAGCLLATADATAINTDYGSLSCSTEAAFTDTCICQKDFWKTDQKSGAAAVCGATTAYIACLKGKTNKACDGSTDVTALATGVHTRITKLGKTDCPVTPTCQCEINNAESDISTDAKKCTALTALKTCLSAITSTTATGCITGTQATLLTDTNTKLATCAADRVTFAMTSLVVSVLVNMFLWRPSVLAL